MSRSFILKNQKIPEAQKTKDWDMNHVYDFLAYSGIRNTDERKQEQLICWQYYTGFIDKEKENRNKVITRPYGFSLGLEYTHYPLIESKVEQFVGEYLARGIKKKTYVLNKKAKSAKLDKMFAMYSEKVMREANAELEPTLGFVPTTENPEMELPEDMEDFFENGSYKTESEEVSDIILEQVLEIKNNKNRIKDLLVDFLVTDEAIANIDQEDSHPAIKRVDGFSAVLDWDPEKEIQKDAQYFIQSKFMAYNEIINEFDLTEEEEKMLKSYTETNTNLSVNYYGVDGYDYGDIRRRFFSTIDSVLRIRVVEMIWISKKQIKVKVSKNKTTGKEIYKVLPNGDKRKGEDIKTVWVDYKRKILMAGPDLILEHGPINERYSRVDNIKKDSINVVGIRRNNFLNSRIRSVASKLMQLQDFASEALFELRLAMRRNAGRVLVYDAAQIPKQFLKTGGYTNAINRVMHHAKKDQFLIINSMDKQARYAFNQFTSLDLSTKGMMQDIFNVLALIEQLADKFIGLAPERQSDINQYQAAQATERSIVQSTARTEVFTSPFDDFLEAILEKVLLKSKYVYEENEVVEYLFGTQKSKFFTVYPSFFQDDIGVGIGNNYKEKKNKDIIDGAASNLFNNAQTPEMILNMIEVLNSDTATESERILRKGIKAMQKLQSQNAKAAQEAEALKAQADQKKHEELLAIEDKKIAKDIRVAEIRENGQTRRNNDNINSQLRIKIAELEKELEEKSN